MSCVSISLRELRIQSWMSWVRPGKTQLISPPGPLTYPSSDTTISRSTFRMAMFPDIGDMDLSSSSGQPCWHAVPPGGLFEVAQSSDFHADDSDLAERRIRTGRRLPQHPAVIGHQLRHRGFGVEIAVIRDVSVDLFGGLHVQGEQRTVGDVGAVGLVQQAFADL